ncbi:uncharacterized protein LOC128200662 [Galleria mellonella]|uniref:Uncharacterized protein LOC128200662 n=1 Tax=Galleria mellonella TaxID=7137 RepID=A0ABM3MHU1_GALME|nr:uncharacterized protein LOC128200662 [Galleria mellonella]
MLIGHGCYGKYLHTVARREEDPGCKECGACDQDTAQHVLESCPAFAEERRALVAVIGDNLSLSSVVGQMVSSESAWMAVLGICEAAMSKKETAEREREFDPSAPQIRRRRHR